MTGKPKPGKWF